MTGLNHRQPVVIIASAAILLGGWLVSGANAQTVTMEQYQHPESEKDFSFNKPYSKGSRTGSSPTTYRGKTDCFAWAEILRS